MNIYDFNVKDTTGNVVSLKKYEGKVLLIVNTATECGFTPQYENLEKLYEEKKDKGFEILGFPCDQFGHGTPGDDSDIAQFCTLNYGVSFPQFSKIRIKGENAHPLFQYLIEHKGFDGFDPGHKLTPAIEKIIRETEPDFELSPSIKWNFTKFLIDREGNIIERFEPTTDVSIVDKRIEELL